MEEAEGAAVVESEADKLRDRHRTEVKELRSRVQALKKSVSKGDKKRKKEVTTEIATLEAELEARHKSELASLEDKTPVYPNGEAPANGVLVGIPVEDSLGNMSLTDSGPEQKEGGGGGGGGKKSKAQKRKAKKAQLERERAQRIAEAEAVSAAEGTPRQQERERLETILTPLGLAIRDITPDGHCLYAAVSDQLSIKMNMKVPVSALRSQCSDYIRAHGEEFLPYLTHPDTGDQFTQEQFGEYCQEIADTASWGGQLEILAFSHIYQVPINVYQASVPKLCIGEEYDQKQPLNLSYHLHEFGLGEHYNSLVPTAATQPAPDSS